MTKILDEMLSQEIASSIKSQPEKCFDNAYRAALVIEGAIYVQGFLVIPAISDQPLEYGWLELGDRIVDPTFPHLGVTAENLYYFPAQSLSIKKLTAILEESKEDYPLDDPLPVYGDLPYEYYGDLMLGGTDYQTAYMLALDKCRELQSFQITN
ncbi:MAG: hypothetical protein EAZ78_11010 [Oscillatoriales cyanobacterium]|uniref:DUF1851 domain-containing protein n=1 Tax=Microcoleus anatoxicus PTRS2 TaxID=2705321 RepID=A0ABU8YIU5_9CYAN|nr:MAG: hypothetical protein EA000_15855 [Oscillatoriales cyanobacterium]TAD96946.1 MAG: hypothetical protein EAZ98_11145 [Oscillatoriales cyanobacterium]TAE00757.1 MAG: hypothetical protein EAZ96_20555 [Oscillatoriales cyanobacterium]TAF03872.1 MAG: hypothetical protein EAZ78_11010 [Oscillatoriales cyanobacterium]TAF33869.1 MAG: hypothetical protein EAZ68_19605 [Oscillatoriales cyanobacterium]